MQEQNNIEEGEVLEFDVTEDLNPEQLNQEIEGPQEDTLTDKELEIAEIAAGFVDGIQQSVLKAAFIKTAYNHMTTNPQTGKKNYDAGAHKKTFIQLAKIYLEIEEEIFPKE